MMRYKRGGEGLKQATKALWDGGFHHRPTFAWQSTHLEPHFFLQFLVNPEAGEEGHSHYSYLQIEPSPLYPLSHGWLT